MSRIWGERRYPDYNVFWGGISQNTVIPEKIEKSIHIGRIGLIERFFDFYPESIVDCLVCVLSASMRDLSDGPVPYKLSIENTEDSHEHQNDAT